jgi:hypothetical protein
MVRQIVDKVKYLSKAPILALSQARTGAGPAAFKRRFSRRR